MDLRLHRLVFPVTVALVTLLGAAPVRADRLRDLCDVVGVRENQVLGYGVVTGLAGQGDDVTAPLAVQSLLSLMRRLGIQIDQAQLRLRNVAAVVVTATLPPFARPGARLDVTVSSIGNARSLQGGVLVQSLLYGADMHVYAVAQGPLVVGGYEARGQAAMVRTNSTNTARIPGGGLVEREVAAAFAKNDEIVLALRGPDFTTAQRIAQAVNANLGAAFASVLDAGAVKVRLPSDMRTKPAELVARIEGIDVPPSGPARVVINERTGTIVAGGDVRLAPSAIAQGGLTIVIKETPLVSQPPPGGLLGGGRGQTVVVPRTEVTPTEAGPQPAMTYVDGATTLADVARALATLGVNPRELGSILQALRAAGALRAEIVMQ